MATYDSGKEEKQSKEKRKKEWSQEISAFSQFDESMKVLDAEELGSTVIGQQIMPNMKHSKSKRSTAVGDKSPEVDVRSPRMDFRRYSVPENSFNKTMGLDSESSDSDDSDDMDIQNISKLKRAELYDFKQFENLDVSAEVKELFQNITRYAPQKIELQYKLFPFIPDYIPAVGDIDAFLKVPRPDGVSDQVGLTVLDEPAAEQSDPAVLHLQLRSKIRSATNTNKGSVVKRLEDASKQSRMIDKWIEDMGELHRSKHLPAVEMSKKFPDFETLLCQWPPEIEDKLSLASTVNFENLDCDLLQLIDLICVCLDIR